MSIALVTDSAADLPKEYTKKHKIEVVPLTIQIGEEDFFDGVTIDNKLFYEKMAYSQSLPKTSLPSPQKFKEVFQRIGPQKQILCITISSATSGTYQSAMLAKESLPDYQIEVIDSLSISMGTGLQVMKAVELVKQGLTFGELKNELLAYRHTMNIFIAIDKLDNVIKGGRISNWKGTIANILNIKPILNIFPDGTLNVVDNVRGRKRQLKRVLELFAQTHKDLTNSKFVILHAKAPLDEINFLEHKIRELFNPQEINIGELGPVMGTHGGFGSIGFAF
ncbi:MAG: hypothetical protein JM58_01060 [Peptococcaceae bacterium BICA1-8]|nr:MAG: hypothetical protein JM58_01060 [Peptococcaceae bacterium BICA1-8]